MLELFEIKMNLLKMKSGRNSHLFPMPKTLPKQFHSLAGGSVQRNVKPNVTNERSLTKSPKKAER